MFSAMASCGISRYFHGLAKASSTVSPCVWQPLSSGQYANAPFLSCSMMAVSLQIMAERYRGDGSLARRAREHGLRIYAPYRTREQTIVGAMDSYGVGGRYPWLACARLSASAAWFEASW